MQPRDPIALAAAISFLLKNPSLRRDLGQKGREYIVSNFSIQTMLHSTLDAYKHFTSQE